MDQNTEAPTEERKLSARILDAIERGGNALPDPVTLFLIGAIFVLIISQIGDWMNWTVQKPTTTEVVVHVEDPETGEMVEQVRQEPGTEPIEARGLLTRDGSFWTLRTMVDNFMAFPPLGVVLVAMLGIGVAEKTGAIGALLKLMMAITPMMLLTPAMVFIGVMSSMAADAGYVVLPPIAAALYKAVGRSPLVGLAAVFAGVSAGFSANLFITSLDPLLSGFTQAGAQIWDPDYTVAATCNWWFMIVSTIIVTFAGWAVTAFFVEPRCEKKPAEEGGPAPATAEDHAARHLTPLEIKGLIWGGVALLLTNIAVFALVLIPGAPLYGAIDPPADEGERWVAVIVPILFFVFLIPGLAYGVATDAFRRETGEDKTDKGVAILMARTMADMGPYIVLAFVAAQFIAYFTHSNLGVMLAVVGGDALQAADMPAWLLMCAFIIVVMLGNLFIGSASAKYAIFAPVFIPMFMQVGISPELAQAAYRVGDSTTNIIAPLNPYMIIILVFVQKYMPKGGLGTIVSLMLPYAVVFWIMWTVMLVIWMYTGFELGPQGPLAYPAPTP